MDEIYYNKLLHVASALRKQTVRIARVVQGNQFSKLTVYNYADGDPKPRNNQSRFTILYVDLSPKLRPTVVRYNTTQVRSIIYAVFFFI